MSEGPQKFRVFDTLRNGKVELDPVEPGKISMYVCGVTVYDYTHIGHARVYVVFDSITRFLRHLGWDVTYVRNHTDVDDKIIKRAAEQAEEPLALAQRFIDAFDEDMGRLCVHAADVEPKVSDHIPEIIGMVETLIEKGYAYAVGGDVYYRVRNFEDYGKLSHRSLDDMEAGRSGRVQDTESKEHPFDFALWKSAKDGEISWDSPWGPGRPGWHIECSAMSTRYLGETFDIHGGGRDLIFPHHENEIAQSEAASGKPFCNHWMHIGMVNVATTDESGQRVEEKMSKSLDNFWTTRDVLERYHPEAIRYFLQTTHYRNPITYSLENLDEATQRVEYLYTTLHRLDEALARAGFGVENPPPAGTWLNKDLEAAMSTYRDRFLEGMCDDFNTPRALASVSEAARWANELSESRKKPGGDQCFMMWEVRKNLVAVAGVLGLLERNPTTALEEIRDRKVINLGLDVSLIEAKIEERRMAREQKDWGRADEVRDELLAMKVEIMDSPDGTTWRVGESDRD